MRQYVFSIAAAIVWLTALPASARAEAELPVDMPVADLVWIEIVSDRRTARPFKTWTHPSPKSVATTCSMQLAIAQWRQDTVSFRDSEAHFDNCALIEGLSFVQERLKEADDEISRHNYRGAMTALGRALHALQDFYSHTNYVERLATQGKPFDELPVLALWTARGAAELRELIDMGLTSGVVEYSTLKRCPAGAPDHNEVAKDTARMNDVASRTELFWNNRSHYTAALDLATRATEDYLSWAFAKWPELERECGKHLGYFPPLDRRDSGALP